MNNVIVLSKLNWQHFPFAGLPTPNLIDTYHKHLYSYMSTEIMYFFKQR